MTNWYEKDRAMGAGLPSGVDLGRLRRRLQQRETRRVASFAGAVVAGFSPLTGHRDILRKGHALWAFRPAEDGEGHVLVRLRDEPAPGVDPRRAQLGAVPTSLSHEVDFNEAVEVHTSFAPLLYGGDVVIPAGRPMTVSGQHPPTPESDRIADPHISTPLYPETEDEVLGMVRIRLEDDETGVEVSLLPLEFERFVRALGEQYPKEPVEHRSRSRPAPPEGIGPDSPESAHDVTEPSGRAPTVNQRPPAA